VIRDRCSSGSKRCRCCDAILLAAWEGNLKCSDSGDSMLARVKIEEIDGVTPQGVDCAA